MSYKEKKIFSLPITERYCLNRQKEGKQTYHISLGLEGKEFRYSVGDSIGIFCENSQSTVTEVLKFFKEKENVMVSLRGHEEKIPLSQALTHHLNINKPSKKLLQLVVETSSFLYKENITSLLQKEKRQEMKAFLETHEIKELLENSECFNLDPQKFCDCLTALLPRLYSIASSQMLAEDRVELVVARVCYQVDGKERLGVCSDYLTRRLAPQKSYVSAYLQKSDDFCLPEDPEAKLIMVGPGTGVAPFRAFMQERQARGDRGKSWLFFGERHRDSDYYYEEEWKELCERGLLQVSTAFSRDQEHKVYVQHRLLEHAEELWQWLKNGAYFMVCGDAKHMAKDVESALLQVITEQGKKDEETAKSYLKHMRKEKRYLRDIY